MVSKPFPAPWIITKSAAKGAPSAISTTTATGCAPAAMRAEKSGFILRIMVNSATRAATCAGPINAPAAIATATDVPADCNSPGKCAASAVELKLAVANTKASKIISRLRSRVSSAESGGAASLGGGGGAFGIRKRLSGRQMKRCKATQPRHAPRQPHSASISAESGQPTVLAKPAISVMPVMLLRASLP